MSKSYLLERENGERYIEQRTQAPESFIAEVPDSLMAEHPDSLKVEEFEDDFGNTQKRTLVDEDLKTVIEEQKATEEAAKEDKKNERSERESRIKGIDWDGVKNLDQLIAIVKDLVERNS